MLRQLLVAALAVLWACAEPTGPESLSVVAEARLVGPASPTPSASELVDFSDVFDRILPSFADQVLAKELQAQLLRLESANRADDHVAAEAELRSARNLIARSDAHPANVGAIRLAMLRIEGLLAIAETEQAEPGADDSKRSP